MDSFVSIILFGVQIYSYCIFGYILLSWFPNAKEGPIGVFLGKICEPFLGPFRSVIPPIGGMIDISPMIAMVVLQLATRGIVTLLGWNIK